VAALGRPPLPVFMQVNTSGEESKHGVEPADCLALARHIHEQCKHLRFAGLMTIGMPGQQQQQHATAWQQQPVSGRVMTGSDAVTVQQGTSGAGPGSLPRLTPRLPPCLPHASPPAPHADYSSRPENFECLSTCRAEVCSALGLPEEEVELSMGMSGDFEQAIEMGSTNVRVGSTIFGARQYA
jgi:uncharacterized pyridoxal phosphate-containing UPF0001 family protein